MNTLFNKLKASLRKDSATTLSSEAFGCTNLLSLGLPGKPSALDYDPCQGLLVVGTYTGSLHLFGKNGFELRLDHPGEPGWFPPEPPLPSSLSSVPTTLTTQEKEQEKTTTVTATNTSANTTNTTPPPLPPPKDDLTTQPLSSNNQTNNNINNNNCNEGDHNDSNITDSTPNLTVSTTAIPTLATESFPLSPGSGSGVIIKHVSFKSGTPLLISLNNQDVLAVFDLSSKTPEKLETIIPLSKGISCLATGGVGVAVAKWVFVGNLDGSVRVVDLSTKTISEYSIIKDETRKFPLFFFSLCTSLPLFFLSLFTFSL